MKLEKHKKCGWFHKGQEKWFDEYESGVNNMLQPSQLLYLNPIEHLHHGRFCRHHCPPSSSPPFCLIHSQYRTLGESKAIFPYEPQTLSGVALSHVQHTVRDCPHETHYAIHQVVLVAVMYPNLNRTYGRPNNIQLVYYI